MKTTIASTFEARSSARSWRGRAFGLELETPFPLSGLLSPNGSASRHTSVEVVSEPELDRRWRKDEAERIVDRRFPDGNMSIDSHERLGYLITWDAHGRHLLSRDGSQIACVLPELSPLLWEKFFFAALIPLAAKLQGLELLHASAVAMEGRVVAFAAHSGVGKSSLAAHLVARGASFVADDVTALESSPAGVIAHPGPALARLSEAELNEMTPEGRGRLGPVLGRSDKVHTAPQVIEHPLPLAAVYVLGRGIEAGAIDVMEIEPPDPRLLLASSFITYVRSPQHLLNHLDVCTRLAASARTFRVRLPRGLPASRVAPEIEAHVRRILGGGKS